MSETEVKWLKMKVGMFDGNSFKKIKRAKIGGVSYRDKLTAVWFELLDLAGKSNCNGLLVDNNEIPYETYEDIAVMLDREEKEIELCMQFFINEQMVEVVNKIYCITKFVEYQNTEGLEKIKEQKRLAQQRWRERKKLGLIGQNVDKNNLLVDTTVDTTNHLPSISLSTSFNKSKKQFIPPTYEEVLEYAISRNREELAKKFYDYYTAGEWKGQDGKPVKNWKQKFITWETHNAKSETPENKCPYDFSRLES